MTATDWAELKRRADLSAADAINAALESVSHWETAARLFRLAAENCPHQLGADQLEMWAHKAAKEATWRKPSPAVDSAWTQGWVAPDNPKLRK